MYCGLREAFPALTLGEKGELDCWNFHKEGDEYYPEKDGEIRISTYISGLGVCDKKNCRYWDPLSQARRKISRVEK